MTAGPAQDPTESGLALRPPEAVMRLERIGSFHPTRLSFMRSLLRRIAREDWTIERERFDLDDNGVGTAIYAASLPQGVVRLVAFSHDLPDDQRTDRVIAERWDATFTLTGAEPDEATLARLRANVPLQEAGRCSAREFVLCRANKSMRLFETVVASLAVGRQPDLKALLAVGYLMRTTAVYGNGKFGLSDLANTFARGAFSRPFEAEMLAVYLVREFTFDLVEHLARLRAPEAAVPLSNESKRALGIGNATGLGMAPFLIGHPILIDRWMLSRETAIARVRGVERADAESVARFRQVLGRAVDHLAEWSTDDSRQMARIELLRQEIPALRTWLESGEGAALLQGRRPWDALTAAAEAQLSTEGQELIISVMLEPQGALIDDLEDSFAADETPVTDPAMTLGALKSLIEERYDWALARDYDDPAEQHLFWYVSEEKLEPRLGERAAEPGADREMPISVARDVKRLYQQLVPLAGETPDGLVAEFLVRAPDQRRIVRRVQSLAAHPYAEVRDNLLARGVMAVDLLRCKLSLFGAGKFDPKSDRWTRITMYQGAPGFAELNPETADDWAFPAFLTAR